MGIILNGEATVWFSIRGQLRGEEPLAFEFAWSLWNNWSKHIVNKASVLRGRLTIKGKSESAVAGSNSRDTKALIVMLLCKIGIVQV